MLNTKSKILVALFLVFVLVSSYCYATVEPRTSEEEAVVTSDETPISEEQETTTTTEQSNWTNTDLFVSDNTVTISNVVDGNAFVIGKEVTVSGEIGGDLFVIADKLNIEGGYIYSNLFACAKEIRINGVVYDVYAVSDSFTLESNGFIYRDMKVTASDVTINGKVRRDAYISTSNITFAENTDATIYGDLHYSSKSELSIPEGAVAGEVKFSQETSDVNNSVVSTIFSHVLDLIGNLLFTFVATLLLLWLTPKFIDRIANSGVAKSFASLGIGFATPIAFVIASFLLILSGIGISVFVGGLFAFIILAFAGTSMASIYFGKLFTKLLKMEGNVKFVLFTLLANLIIWAISLIPVVGEIISFVLVLFGIGTTLVNMVWRKEKVEEKVEVVK